LAKTVHGKTYQWRLGDAPIGSGDAGEVYAVVCVDRPELSGVLKKPSRIATGGTIQRQAGQIAQEGLALAQLEGLPACKAHPPQILDQAPEFTQGTANFFIVSETAPGEDMAAMLVRTRQEGTPFPRRVILTVLDALFDLFARAHRSGVLWNDVKLEHIYWDNSSGDVAVIDWGNAQFLDQTDGQRRSLPRWEDYRQLVDTLGVFLQQSAPELYEDLGWSEFQGAELDLPRISVLARRIAYQHEVIALRVMEYQALIKVVLNGDPSLEGLQKIQTYQKILRQIGAPWESSRVLTYGQELVETVLAADDNQTAVRATTIIWELFGENLNLAWHLLREYFRNPDILSQPQLAALVTATLHENWNRTLWHLAEIASANGPINWWDQLVPVIRQKALSAATPLPRQVCQTLLDWVQAGPSADPVEIAELRALITQWRVKGEDLQDSPLDYALLDIARNRADLPRRLRSELKSGFAAGEDAIRTLLQSWVNMDWETLPQALRLVIAWDPDRWGILSLAEAVRSFQAWQVKLASGPAKRSESAQFIKQLMEDRPQLEHLLGNPSWLQALLAMLAQIQAGDYLADLQVGIQTWCPWLLGFETIHDTEAKLAAPDDATINRVLTHFSQHLKSWSDLDTGLESVRTVAPAFYHPCRQLSEGFQKIFHLNLDLDELKGECQAAGQPALEESCDVLQTLIAWREALEAQDLEKALDLLEGESFTDWRILEHAQQATRQWTEQIQPCLDAIRALEPTTCPEGEPHLQTVLNTIGEIIPNWNQVYDSSPHNGFLEVLESTCDRLQNEYHIWRAEMDHAPDETLRLLYHSHLKQVRSISDTFLKLAQHSRQAKMSFASLENENALPYARQLQAGVSLLDHLAAIEAILVSEEAERRFPAWHATFQAVASLPSLGEQRNAILEMDRHHPLYAWLVQSTLGLEL
jgi:serine/threonine protein kinase